MKTQRKVVVVLSIFAMAIILLSTVLNWSPSEAETNGSALWGTWYVTFAGGPGANIPAIVTINRDGTFASSDGSDFGGPPFPVQQSPIRGVWVRTGAHTFEGKAIYFNGDVETGELVHITGSRIIIELGDDFDHINGTLFRDIFECPTPFTCPDPLTAEPDRTNPPVPFQGTRLRVDQ